MGGFGALNPRIVGISLIQALPGRLLVMFVVSDFAGPFGAPGGQPENRKVA